jgi:hypothetical protein
MLPILLHFNTRLCQHMNQICCLPFLNSLALTYWFTSLLVMSLCQFSDEDGTVMSDLFIPSIPGQHQQIHKDIRLSQGGRYRWHCSTVTQTQWRITQDMLIRVLQKIIDSLQTCTDRNHMFIIWDTRIIKKSQWWQKIAASIEFIF